MIAACHKAPEWSYEKEWRYVDIAFRNQYPIKPSRIILGARINEAMRTEITRVSGTLGVQLLQAGLSRRDFTIKITSL
jgi:hypothetical protein